MFSEFVLSALSRTYTMLRRFWQIFFLFFVNNPGSFSSYVPNNAERLVLVLSKDFHALNDIGAAYQAVCA
jgi:hypothetical protein